MTERRDNKGAKRGCLGCIGLIALLVAVLLVAGMVAEAGGPAALLPSSLKSSDRLLADLVNSKSSWLQRRAAHELAKRGDIRVLEPLVDVLMKAREADLRIEACQELSRLGDTRAIHALLQVLSSEETSRIELARARSLKPGPPGGIELAAESAVRRFGDRAGLDDPSPDIRKFATLRLGRARAIGAVDTLLDRGVHDPDSGVRHEAIGALADIGGPGIDRLVSIIGTGINQETESNVIIALGKAKDPRAVSALISVLRRPKYDGLQPKAAEALGEIGKPAYEGIISLLEDDRAYEFTENAWRGSVSPDTSTSVALTALQHMKDPRAIEPIMRVYQKGHAKTSDAARTLAAIGPEAIPALLRIASTPTNRDEPGLSQRQSVSNTEYRHRAWVALGEMSSIGDAAVGPLVNVMQEVQGEARLGAAYGLSLMTNSPRADAALQTVAKTGDLKIIAAAYRYMMRRAMDVGPVGAIAVNHDVVDKLARALEEYGDGTMATEFLKHGGLSPVALAWAKRHGYEVRTRYR